MDLLDQSGSRVHEDQLDQQVPAVKTARTGLKEREGSRALQVPLDQWDRLDRWDQVDR